MLRNCDGQGQSCDELEKLQLLPKFNLACECGAAAPHLYVVALKHRPTIHQRQHYIHISRYFLNSSKQLHKPSSMRIMQYKHIADYVA
jgi:hypothetical protein